MSQKITIAHTFSRHICSKYALWLIIYYVRLHNVALSLCFAGLLSLWCVLTVQRVFLLVLSFFQLWLHGS